MLCDEQGEPLSIEVFSGNTQDPKTVASQIRKTAHRFECEEVTFVGDRGMIKRGQMEALGEEGFHYITAITKPQIEGLIHKGVLQMDLFDDMHVKWNMMASIMFCGATRFAPRSWGCPARQTGNREGMGTSAERVSG